MLTAWLLFPVVLAALALGCGLLLEHASGTAFRPALLLPAGTAVMIAVALFPPVFESTAFLSSALVVASAAAGYALARPFRRARMDSWAAGTAVTTYVAFGAPVLCIWRRTFAGYIKLDDTATYLAMLDRYLGHGYDVAGLAPSTYERTLATSLSTGYPMGSLMPLGVGHELLGTDSAWLWQPYLCFLAAMVALGLYVLAEPLVRSRPLRAFGSTVAASAALLYGYALWGGVKELAQAMLLVLIGALLPIMLRAPTRRATLPPAVAAAATLGVQSAAGVLWLAVPAVAVAATLARRRAYGAGATLVVATAALSIPTLAAASMWLHHTGAFTSGSELGNLYHPLNWAQIFGIWPTGDFRNSATHGTVTGVLIALTVLGGVLAPGVAWIRRGFGLLLYAGTALVGSSIFWLAGSPWIGAKAIAIASPLFLALALAAAGWVFEQGRRLEAIAATAAILFGVAWSDALAYHDVLLAPNARLTELEAIGERFAGEGPTLETDYDPYGARHFLRSLDAEGASELRVRPVSLRTGGLPQRGSSPDIDEIALPAVLVYRTLVIRRSPAASRPPSVYRMVAQGRYYEVWQRPPTRLPTIVDHLSLGDRFHAAAVPSCADVMRLAREAGPSGLLATVFRPANVAVDLDGSAPGPPGDFGETRGLAYLSGEESFPIELRVPVSGVYEIGIDGDFLSRLDLFVGSKRVASARHELNWPSQYNPLATVRLQRGPVRLTLRYDGPDIHPGSAGQGTGFGLGPLIVGRTDPADVSVTYVRPAEARSLCGRSLDWIEAVRK